MDFIRKLLLRLDKKHKKSDHSFLKNKDEDDPGNVVYETFEWGFKYPEEEIGCQINLMKHRNEL